MLINLFEQDGYSLKREPRHGGKVEFSSACPYCNPGASKTRSDRLCIWPEEGETGKYWCRQCQKFGDGIQYLRDFRGLSYKEACGQLGVTPAFSKRYSGFTIDRKRKPFSNISTTSQSKTKISCWNDKPQKFVEWTHKQLLSDSQQVEYLQERGISLRAIKKYKLGYNPTDVYRKRSEWGLSEETNQKTGKPKKIWAPAGIVIPYWDDDRLVRIRIRRFKKDDFGKYIIISGSDARPFVIPCNQNHSYCIVVEAELDAIMLHDQTGNFMNVIGLGSAGKNPCEKSGALLTKASKILVALDANDEAGAKAYQAKWKFARSKRWIYPGYKDPGDAYVDGKDIVTWVKAGLLQSK